MKEGYAKSVATVNGVSVSFYSRHQGTEDCEVRFQMSRKLFQAFLKFYGKTHMYFKAFEIFAQGGGWYVAYSDNFVKDGALRVRRLIHRALSAITSGITRVQELFLVPNLVAIHAPCVRRTRKIVKVHVEKGKKKVCVVSRFLQAFEQKISSGVSLLDQAIKEELLSIHNTMKSCVAQSKLQELQRKYSHA